MLPQDGFRLAYGGFRVGTGLFRVGLGWVLGWVRLGMGFASSLFRVTPKVG